MMIDWFDRLYTSVSSIRNKYLRKGLRLSIKVIANWSLPLWFNFLRFRDCSLDPSTFENTRVIVSLTSFPLRINSLHIVCETILRQTRKPDMIIVWLSKNQFPSIDILPRKLLMLQKRGVQVRLVEGDIRSHKKYYYALLEFPKDNILIIDDDILYRSTMIQNLLDYQRVYPAAIVAQYGRKIARDSGNVQTYEKWKQIKDIESDSADVFFGSGGGTLIPPHSLFEDVIRKDLFLELAPFADDVWLNAMARLQGTKIVKTKYYSSNLELMYKNNKTLATINNSVQRNMNDVQIESLSNYYGNKLIW